MSTTDTQELPRISQPGEVASYRQIDATSRPVWDFDDLIAVFNIPLSTLDMLIRETPIDGMFLLGRKRYVTPANAMAWLDVMAQKHA